MHLSLQARFYYDIDVPDNGKQTMLNDSTLCHATWERSTHMTMTSIY